MTPVACWGVASRRQTWRRAGLAVSAIGAAVLLGACEADLVLDLDVDADGSGRVEVRLETDESAVAAVDEAVADAAAATDVAVGDPLGAFAATARDLDGWEVTDATADEGGRIVAAATEVDGPAELESVTSELAAALDGPDGRLLGPVTVAVDETADTVRLEGELAAEVDPAAALGWAEPPEDLRVAGEPLDRLAAGDDAPLGVRVTATLPGPVVDANADDVDGQTLTWHGEPGEAREIHAVAERPAVSERAWRVGGAVAAVLLAAAVVLVALLLRRRRAG